MLEVVCGRHRRTGLVIGYMLEMNHKVYRKFMHTENNAIEFGGLWSSDVWPDKNYKSFIERT